MFDELNYVSTVFRLTCQNGTLRKFKNLAAKNRASGQLNLLLLATTYGNAVQANLSIDDSVFNRSFRQSSVGKRIRNKSSAIIIQIKSAVKMESNN